MAAAAKTAATGCTHLCQQLYEFVLTFYYSRCRSSGSSSGKEAGTKRILRSLNNIFEHLRLLGAFFRKQHTLLYVGRVFGSKPSHLNSRWLLTSLTARTRLRRRLKRR